MQKKCSGTAYSAGILQGNTKKKDAASQGESPVSIQPFRKNQSLAKIENNDNDNNNNNFKKSIL